MHPYSPTRPRPLQLAALLIPLLLGGTLWPSGLAWAVDGVLEINQTCASQTGCFAGDTAGYPVTIDGQAGRSYRLTSDLIVPDEFTDGIFISTSRIMIDLNGFEIVRAGCETATTDCTPILGTGSGVGVQLTSSPGISVKNGRITGMGAFGVFLGRQAEITNLRALWNGQDGIWVSSGSTVIGNSAFQNGDDGIVAGSGSVVTRNSVYQNGDDGIWASDGSTISGNSAYQNGGDGIFAHFGSTVERNTVRSNGNFGLRLVSTAAYRENVITNNLSGTVSGGVNMLGNSCDGTTTCP